ncbi:phage scaffolding protein [Anaerofustis stercorihominis]|uniref:phage scaffolding protein n=1 Tax=Anaerofustis stercorihominis TaxID=214853 RepID=UPI003995B720
MKKERFIELGVNEELAKEFEKESEKELKGYIPKSRFDEVNNSKKQLEEDLKERNEQLDDLKKSNGNIEDLKQQIQQMQEENQTKEENRVKEIQDLKIKNAVELSAVKNNCINNKFLEALLDYEKITIDDDGNVTGIDEQIQGFMSDEKTNMIFGKVENEIKGAELGEEGDIEPSTEPIKESEMNYDQYMEYWESKNKQ